MKNTTLRGDSSRQCIPFNHDIEAVDFQTRHCIVKARARAEDKVAKACPLLPNAPNTAALAAPTARHDGVTDSPSIQRICRGATSARGIALSRFGADFSFNRRTFGFGLMRLGSTMQSI